MMDEKIKEMINRHLDGLLSDEEQQQLENLLQQNPDAEQYYQKMKKMKELLDQVPPVEVSASLKTSIMNGLDASRYVKKKKKWFDFSALGQWLDAFRLRPSYAFVLGVVVSALVFTIIVLQIPGPGRRGNQFVLGTMKTAEQQVPIESSFATGIIGWQSSAKESQLHISLKPKSQLVLKLEFDSQKLQLKSMVSDPQINFSFVGQENQLKIQTKNDLSISLSLRKLNRTASLSVKILVENKEIFDHILSL